MKKKNLQLPKLGLNKETIVVLEGDKTQYFVGGATQLTMCDAESCPPQCIDPSLIPQQCHNTGASGCQPCQTGNCPTLRCP